ncbi:serine/arginine repetitive matrix protein 1-like [Pollicipes pollicipes]|uniref:serine/arginine repetitive matrix protein 1-like n=1 Tax=Pollicipes pollicipes TaxID=41117 RepID=UPI0018851DB4|nr:serine/arginine repetitive matrix protein 1-like [Pollicipes pollicipes]
MEGLRSEISQKIKKAIQAKLVELGVTIDEELPDYVMVLVVNKKSKKQMEDDLSLFLLEHTKAFVEWLQEILGRLQAMSVQAKEKTKTASTKTPLQDTAETKERKRSSSLSQPENEKKSRRESEKGQTSKSKQVSSPLPKESKPDVPSDPPLPCARSREASRDSSETRDWSNSRGASNEPGKISSRDRPKFRNTFNECGRSPSRDRPKSRHSSDESGEPESRDPPKFRNTFKEFGDSVSRDRPKSRHASDESGEPGKSRDRPSSRHVSGRAGETESRDGDEISEPITPGDRRGAEEPPGRRHPRISFPSDDSGGAHHSARNGGPAGRAAADGVPSPASTAMPGGRVINLREESSFAAPRRSRSRSPVRRAAGDDAPSKSRSGRRGPQSTVGAVLSRPPAAEDEEEAATPAGAVASAVRVTERPRPPADLLPRPAILIKAMRDAQRSTGAAGRSPAPEEARDRAPPPPPPVGKKELFTRDLRSRERSSRGVEARRASGSSPVPLAVTVRASPEGSPAH